METNKKYILASGTQVRKEDFGLLFYTKTGPRLYFLSCGQSLAPDFFEGRLGLDQWIENRQGRNPVTKTRLMGIRKGLQRLNGKGVIREC
jgi:hypothetical protein